MTAANARFWNLIAKRYARQPVADEEAYQFKLAKTREYLQSSDVILEVGCGTASTAITHAPFVGSIHAVDISSKMLAIGRQRAEDAGVTNIEFIEGDVSQWGERSGEYEVVMAHSLLHLLVDRPAMLNTLYRLLKPGGVFVSSTPCMADTGGLLPKVLRFFSRMGLLPPIGFFSEDALVAEMANAGFVLDYQWQPKPGAALFVIARKAGDER